jgi:hypothetical protein
MRSRIESCIGMASIWAGVKKPTSSDSSLVASFPPHQAAGEADRELLTDLVVAVLDHMLGVGVDAHDSLGLDLQPGLLSDLAGNGVGDALPDLHAAAGDRPQLVVGPGGAAECARPGQRQSLRQPGLGGWPGGRPHRRPGNPGTDPVRITGCAVGEAAGQRAGWGCRRGDLNPHAL